MAYVRRALADLIDLMEIKGDPCLMGDRKEMKGRVGGAAESHICGQGILQSLFCHDLARTAIHLQHLHDLHSGCLCKAQSLSVYSRDRSVSRKAKSQNLCQAVHGVCRKHTGAGAAARTAAAFDLCQLLIIDEVCLSGADCFKYGIQILLI